MGCFYFTIPVVGGWYVMQWAISKSVDEIGARGEKLQNKQLEGFGNKTLIDGKEERIGAGGGKFGGSLCHCFHSYLPHFLRQTLWTSFQCSRVLPLLIFHVKYRHDDSIVYLILPSTSSPQQPSTVRCLSLPTHHDRSRHPPLSPANDAM